MANDAGNSKKTCWLVPLTATDKFRALWCCMARNASKRWVSTVKTDSTHPPKGLFTKKASTIASTLASKRVSPKGPQSGLRMLNYFINRAGKNLSASRRAELKRAQALLSKRLKRNRTASKIRKKT
jgi:tRNA(adenine34) deaminase